MRTRRWGTAAGLSAGVIAVAALCAGCGGTAHATPKAPEVVHVDGVQTGDYVREIAADGAAFLVPTGVLAGQGARSFEVAAHAKLWTGPSGAPPQPSVAHWRIVQARTAVFSVSAKVELLVTGSAGRRLYVSWEETCGGTRVGKRGVVGGAGGQGGVMLRSPAVVMVKLPRVTAADDPQFPAKAESALGKVHGPNRTCYLAATAFTPGAARFHIEIIDY